MVEDRQEWREGWKWRCRASRKHSMCGEIVRYDDIWWSLEMSGFTITVCVRVLWNCGGEG
jgi:hypothetical protein